MNKSLISNLISFVTILLGFYLDNNILLSIGLFAFSGAITNSLAIHMLFHKVPLLYGSGVIESRFEDFKLSIHNLMMNQFFTKENLSKFFEDEIGSSKGKFDLAPILEETDLSPAFDSLKQAVVESSFGGMLNMFGGVAALEPLKEPFTLKLKKSIIEISSTQSFQDALHKSLGSSEISDDIYKKVSAIVDKRLDELSPTMVKNIIQDMIKEHLGWLVVWGGVIGGLIGLVSALVIG
ncbi:MAG: DUF445 domain-containing protein [Campylobacteraceae bacterium]|nr:DUF445 domain-containing protein [Campylobacteraceae bacterium]